MQKAISCHEQHLALAEEASDRLGVNAARKNLAEAYEKMGEHEKIGYLPAGGGGRKTVCKLLGREREV